VQEVAVPIDLSVVVPVYDELDNLEPLLERVHAALEPTPWTWELVAVDDASRDGSGDWLDAAASDRPWMRVLHFTANRGQSAALAAGFRHAHGRLVGILDADLQTFPEDLPGLVERLEADRVDAVIGIRTDRQDTGWKRFSSKFANGVRNRLTREDIVDTGCPLKVIRAGALRELPVFNGLHRFLPTLLRMHGAEVVQVPVRHAPRVHGASKYGTWDRAFRGLRDALGVRWLQDRHIDWTLK
jgi:glycosyltransferase involved in cell wall biosynthesis